MHHRGAIESDECRAHAGFPHIVAAPIERKLM